MNPLSYYERSKTPWNEHEYSQVKKEYETDLLDITQIANIHKRTPSSIAYALKWQLKIIVHIAASRGYPEYRTSKLYEEVCASCKKEDNEKEKRKEERAKAKEERKEGEKKANEIVKDLEKDMDEDSSSIKVPKRMVAIMLELESVKNEIKELKSDVKWMLFYMKSLYDFEVTK
jgi:uncharacterized Zn finger protein (UPF0148 family)